MSLPIGKRIKRVCDGSEKTPAFTDDKSMHQLVRKRSGRGRTGDRASSERGRERGRELAESDIKRACEEVSTVESFRRRTGLGD